jgi:hypothetical protein
MNGMEEQLRQFDLLGRDWETINDPAIREAQQEIIRAWCISHGEEPPKGTLTLVTVIAQQDHEEKEEEQKHHE